MQALSVFYNSTIKWVFLFQNNPKDQDTSDNTDVVLWDCFGMENPRLIRNTVNHGVEFNQTCYITSTCGKGVQNQHCFPIRPGVVHLLVTLCPPKSLGGIYRNLLHIFPGWQGFVTATLFLHLSMHLSIQSRYLLLNHWTEFTKLATWLPYMVRVYESTPLPSGIVM